MLISWDLDDVVCVAHPVLHKWHKMTYGSSYTGPATFDLRLSWDCDEAEALRRLAEFWQTDVGKNLPLHPSVVDVLNVLHEDAHVITTSRPESMADFTREYVHRKLPGRFQDVYFASHQHLSYGNGMTKAQHCVRMGAELHIDDSREHVIDCAKHGITALLMDADWNKGELPPGAYRITSHRQIPDFRALTQSF